MIEMIKKIGMFVGLLVIIFALIAIFKILAHTELAIGFITLSFGILAIIWITMAARSLSSGSSLRVYTIDFLLCVVFILTFSILYLANRIFLWDGAVIVYLQYLFITLSFIIIVVAAYQILTIGREFGFRKEAIKIKKAMEKNK